MNVQAELNGGVATATAPKQGIVWIASFPKSGNTWTRTFLHNLVNIQSGNTEAQRINEMNRFSTWDIDKKIYEKLLGYVLRSDQKREIAATRHKVHEYIADGAEGLVFVKSHNALVMDRGYSTINFAVTSGAIYIVRNPLDVAISYAHHMGISIDSTIAKLAAENAETKATTTAVYEVLGSWSQHVMSWTRKPHRAIYVMRYEDMLADPHQAFGRLARHLLLDPTEEQLMHAIDLSSFEKLKEQEEKGGFRERPKEAKRFFREGRAGQWKETLTPLQIQRIIRDHREQMTRFGYLKGDGTPV
jgi:hypothetical protein